MEVVFSQLATASAFSLLGVLAGLLSGYAFVPYIIDTVKGRTQPRRSSWLIWSILGLIGFFSQRFEGAGASLWFAGVQVTGTLVIFLLSVRTGFGRYLTNADLIVLALASIGLFVWLFMDTAAYTLAIIISISLAGGSVTITRAYREPDTETFSTWVLYLLASLCAVLSVGTVDWVLLAYPLYLGLLYALIVSAILLGKYVNRPRRAHLQIRAVDIAL